VALSLAVGLALGIVAGGLLGPLAGMAMPAGGPELRGDSDLTGLPVDVDEAAHEVAGLPQSSAAPKLGAPSREDPAP
jgi:hypothetical protein